MCRLVESIKVEDGRPRNLTFHNRRMNSARSALFGRSDHIDLGGVLTVPSSCRSGVFKCRVVYAHDIIAVEFVRYERRIIRSLKAVYDDVIDYAYKYEDRESIQKLLEQKEDCDDILIIKNNLVTDTSFSNITCYDGDRWVTPSTPLLKGTKRDSLLSEGIIEEEIISVSDLRRFFRLSFINAMLDLGDSVIDIADIVL
ncbi:MAG: hypothetical protein A2176_00525 [Spirochaetes bacterium RBG_13_51_14]|nr:MAG: hypothetical protein A2176_00525 [Spirochaetes bacterium RBG_13_51_14]